MPISGSIYMLHLHYGRDMHANKIKMNKHHRNNIYIYMYDCMMVEKVMLVVVATTAAAQL